MKKIILTLFVCIFFVSTQSVGEIVDRVVAEVNDDIITLSELNNEGRKIFQRIRDEAPPEKVQATLDEARKQILSKMIDERITAHTAREKGISVSVEDLDMAVQSIIARNKSTREGLRHELSRVGITEEEFRESIRTQVLHSKLVNYEVRSKIVITEEKIKEAYGKQYTKNASGSGYYILQMGFAWGEKNNLKQEEAEKLANQIRDRVTAGESFKELAKTYSDLPSATDGGDIGVFQKGELAPYMKDTILAMRPGDISPVIETKSGYQFFKLLSTKDGNVVAQEPYEEVKDEISKQLFKEEMEKRYEEWIKALREQAYIKELL